MERERERERDLLGNNVHDGGVQGAERERREGGDRERGGQGEWGQARQEGHEGLEMREREGLQ